MSQDQLLKKSPRVHRGPNYPTLVTSSWYNIRIWKSVLVASSEKGVETEIIGPRKFTPIAMAVYQGMPISDPIEDSKWMESTVLMIDGGERFLVTH